MQFCVVTDFKKIVSELTFKTSRSSGAGGQNVNKVESKVELRFDVYNSTILSEEQKEKFAKRWHNRINSEGVFVLCSSQHRSQLANKEHTLKKFFNMLETSLKKQKKRIATQPTKAAIAKQKQTKAKRSEIKQSRSKIKLSD